MSVSQFRRRTSEPALPDEVYQKYEHVVKTCKICSYNTQPPYKSKISGLRAQNFGDVAFADHAEVHNGNQKFAVLLILDGATNLLWARPQVTLTAEETLEGLREWSDTFQCIPKAIVTDMAFTGPQF